VWSPRGRPSADLREIAATSSVLWPPAKQAAVVKEALRWFRDLPSDDAGWPHFLARLSIAARGGDPGPDPFATATTGNG
jgi:hypothetical protein